MIRDGYRFCSLGFQPEQFLKGSGWKPNLQIAAWNPSCLWAWASVMSSWWFDNLLHEHVSMKRETWVLSSVIRDISCGHKAAVRLRLIETRDKLEGENFKRSNGVVGKLSLILGLLFVCSCTRMPEKFRSKNEALKFIETERLSQEVADTSKSSWLRSASYYYN